MTVVVALLGSVLSVSFVLLVFGLSPFVSLGMVWVCVSVSSWGLLRSDFLALSGPGGELPVAWLILSVGSPGWLVFCVLSVWAGFGGVPVSAGCPCGIRVSGVVSASSLMVYVVLLVSGCPWVWVYSLGGCLSRAGVVVRVSVPSLLRTSLLWLEFLGVVSVFVVASFPLVSLGFPLTVPGVSWSVVVAWLVAAGRSLVVALSRAPVVVLVWASVAVLLVLLGAPSFLALGALSFSAFWDGLSLLLVAALFLSPVSPVFRCVPGGVSWVCVLLEGPWRLGVWVVPLWSLLAAWPASGVFLLGLPLRVRRVLLGVVLSVRPFSPLFCWVAAGAAVFWLSGCVLGLGVLFGVLGCLLLLSVGFSGVVGVPGCFPFGVVLACGWSASLLVLVPWVSFPAMWSVVAWLLSVAAGSPFSTLGRGGPLVFLSCGGRAGAASPAVGSSGALIRCLSGLSGRSVIAAVSADSLAGLLVGFP
ncbi:hypothetical protein [Halomonas cupida]|uniref:hypothetical protein n=1 Tax=Halomonas cupida TaxID=44933 RepID=UPI001160EC38|nr:hypothetical protein [Halomonas cupida]